MSTTTRFQILVDLKMKRLSSLENNHWNVCLFKLDFVEYLTPLWMTCNKFCKWWITHGQKIAANTSPPSPFSILYTFISIFIQWTSFFVPLSLMIKTFFFCHAYSIIICRSFKKRAFITHLRTKVLICSFRKFKSAGMAFNCRVLRSGKEN